MTQKTVETVYTIVKITISQNTPGEPHEYAYCADSPEARSVLLAAVDAALNTYVEWYNRTHAQEYHLPRL